jgi:hypothetical protein
MLAAHAGKSPRPLAETAVVGASWEDPQHEPLGVHPPQPIAEDFIARALQDRPTGGLSGIPPGMMSLGSAGAD